MPEPFRVGDRVRWTDPDDDACSGDGTIEIITDDVLTLKMDGGGETEAYMRECKRVQEGK